MPRKRKEDTRSEFDRLPKRVRTLVERCRRGQVLCRSYRPRAVGEDTNVLNYWFEPSGLPAPAISATEAIERGYLAPQDAGLFSDGNAQSFIAAPASP
ncbi:hypothetical protein [Methylorubrum extorquens]